MFVVPFAVPGAVVPPMPVAGTTATAIGKATVESSVTVTRASAWMCEIIASAIASKHRFWYACADSPSVGGPTASIFVWRSAPSTTFDIAIEDLYFFAKTFALVPCNAV